MKHVNFKKIQIANFLSVGLEPVVVHFNRGLHIITGINKDKLDRRNGVGKSTIADAIHFAIFGSTIRELKKENIVNNIIGKGCEVVLEFDIVNNEDISAYKIVRKIEPSKCFLYIDGEDKTRDSIINTTEYICNILETSQDTFQNCVVLTLNNTIPFMGKKKVEKRKFIEGIFGLEVFGSMLSLLRHDHSDVKRSLDISSTRHEEVNKTFAEYQSKREEFINNQKERYQSLVDRKNNNIQELDSLRDKIFETNKEELDTIEKAIKSKEENIEACESKITSLNKKVSTLETEVRIKKEKIDEVGTDKEKCPVCLKRIDNNDRAHIEKEKTTIREDIESLRQEVSKLNDNLDIVDKLKTDLKIALQSQNELYNEHVLKIKDSDNNKQRMEQLKKWNDQLEEDFKQFNNETTEFDNSINESKKRLDDLQVEIDGIKHRLAILDVVKFIVSEEGVKSYIVRKILQLFNSKLAYYLSKMDANCLCIFNEYFEEEIIDEKGKVCSYYNFSGAERKNIDLACLFAFMDIRRLQGNIAYNFSVYDELLDTSLDERGVDLVLDILRERVEKYNECIMVISHRKESIKIGSHYKNTGEIIFLEKENGITRRVEFIEQ